MAYFHSFLQMGRFLVLDTPVSCATDLDKQRLNIFPHHLKPGWEGHAFIWTVYYIKYAYMRLLGSKLKTVL